MHDSALLTDQYELTMAHGYWQLGMAERTAVFLLSYRNNPFKGNYTVACGLHDVIRFIDNFSFSQSDIEYLESLQDSSGKPLFKKEFLQYLYELKLSCSIDAIPEGSLVFANEPMLRIQGPLLQCQLLETALINYVNYATLVATKASRICSAASGDDVVEFGARRAHGPNGCLTSSRAAFVGGCSSTSLTLAGKQFGIPIKGTQAHSWVMAFDNELDAFRRWADIMGENSVLLIDTYDSSIGVENAITVGNELRAKGKDLLGVRLDSGDLATLSIAVRNKLDQAGFSNTKILASGDLDEYIISQLKKRGAKIDMWGVGTKLSTCFEQPSLNMIYKLAAMHDETGQWQYRLKISDQKEKTTMAGVLQVRRYREDDAIIKDVIYDVDLGLDNDQGTDLLVPIFKQGKLVYQAPSIEETRAKALHEVAQFTAQKQAHQVLVEDQLQALQDKLLQK